MELWQYFTNNDIIVPASNLETEHFDIHDVFQFVFWYICFDLITSQLLHEANSMSNYSFILSLEPMSRNAHNFENFCRLSLFVLQYPYTQILMICNRLLL